MSLPGACPKPCKECPWRIESAAGWLGPLSVDEWIMLAHSDEPIACHLTISETDENGVGSWDQDKIKQCRGAANYRRNVGKSPRNPNALVGEQDDSCFASPMAFKDHHERIK